MLVPCVLHTLINDVFQHHLNRLNNLSRMFFTIWNITNGVGGDVVTVLEFAFISQRNPHNTAVAF